MALLFGCAVGENDMHGDHIGDIPDAFFEMMQEIVEHPERSVSLEALAAKYYLNPSYISTRFRKLFGISPVRLHQRVVIERAKTILREDASCAVSALAAQLGFKDVSTFTHFFKAREGCSPSDYRRKFFR